MRKFEMLSYEELLKLHVAVIDMTFDSKNEIYKRLSQELKDELMIRG